MNCKDYFNNFYIFAQTKKTPTQLQKKTSTVKSSKIDVKFCTNYV